MVDHPVISPAPTSPAGSKPAWKSKTLWMSLVTAAAPFVPVVGPFIQANPQASMVILGLVFSALRAVTRGAVTIS